MIDGMGVLKPSMGNCRHYKALPHNITTPLPTDRSCHELFDVCADCVRSLLLLILQHPDSGENSIVSTKIRLFKTITVANVAVSIY